MKDKEKQIEEIANMLEDFRTYRRFCGCNGLAKMIYDKLLPEDSVVISRGEYKRLKKVETEKDRLYEIKLDLENQLIEKGWTEYEGADEIEKRVSKETAEKISKEIKQEIFNYLNVKSMAELDNLSLVDSLMPYDVITDKLNEIEKQYGVDTNKVLKDKTED